jgi:hypothetical protein
MTAACAAGVRKATFMSRGVMKVAFLTNPVTGTEGAR